MDLRQFAPTDEGAVMELKNPYSGEVLCRPDGKAPWVKLAGLDSPRWRKTDQAITNRRIKAAAAKQGRVTMTASEMEADEIDKICAVTIEWGNIELDGEVLELTHDNARRLYNAVPSFFRQAQMFVSNSENFMKGGDGI